VPPGGIEPPSRRVKTCRSTTELRRRQQIVARVLANAPRHGRGEAIAEAQGIPLKFLENILGELKHTGIVASRRGAQGGYWLAKPADEVALADVVRAVMDEVALADVVGGKQPAAVRELSEPAEAWSPR
jgi:Rrf2 family protein